MWKVWIVWQGDTDLTEMYAFPTEDMLNGFLLALEEASTYEPNLMWHQFNSQAELDSWKTERGLA